MIYLQDPDVTLYQGDVLDTLRELEAGSVDCVITSPPYWGLRDYGTGEWEGGDAGCDHIAGRGGHLKESKASTRGGANKVAEAQTVPMLDVCSKCGATRIDRQLGLEPTPDEYVARMVDVFREVRRVLADHGTCWVNLGDSYASGHGGSSTEGAGVTIHKARTDQPKTGAREGIDVASWSTRDVTPRNVVPGLKPKDLVGIPWLVARALQEPYYTGRVKSASERTWLAAILDGEGTICGMRHERPDGNIRTGCMVFITNTSEPLLDECDRIWKGARYSEKTTSEVARPCWRWELQAAEERSALVRELYPYLIEKKQQALVAWNLLEIVQAAKKLGRGGETKATKDRRDYLVRLLSDLNGRRPVDLPSWLQVPPSLFEPGWYVRSDVIWSKNNPMPESVTDRPTKSHEYVFLLSKRPRYFFDQEAVREPAEWQRWGVQTTPKHNGTPTGAGWIKPKGKQELLGEQQAKLRGGDTKSGFNERWFNGEEKGLGRNIRSVWDIATQPYSEAHFATFPEELVRRCLLAGCPERVCRVCGKPRERIVDSKPMSEVCVLSDGEKRRGRNEQGLQSDKSGLSPSRVTGMPVGPQTKTVGWSHCAHSTRPENLRPGVVLDPFMGSGTVAVVARKHNRHAVGIDLNPEYLAMAARRLSQQSLFALEAT